MKGNIMFVRKSKHNQLKYLYDEITTAYWRVNDLNTALRQELSELKEENKTLQTLNDNQYELISKEMSRRKKLRDAAKKRKRDPKTGLFVKAGK